MRHDLYARMRELSSKFEGVETVDVGTLPRRVRRENPDITSPLTKKTCPADFITFPQVSRTARAEATSLVRETREKVGDLKGRPSHVTVRLRVLVQKLASVSSHWRRATCYYREPTRASELATHDGNYCAPKFPSFSTRLPFHFPLGARLVSRWPCLLSHRSGGRGCLCRAERPRNIHWDS